MNIPEITQMDRLMREFLFNMEDLVENRAGRMSGRQKSRAMRDGTWLFYVSLAACVLIPVVFLGVDWTFRSSTDLSDWILDGIKALLVMGIPGVFAWMGWRSRRAGQAGLVKPVTGKVRFEKEKKKTFLCVGDEIHMEVDEKMMDWFEPQTDYRFYCSTADKCIWSVEPIH